MTVWLVAAGVLVVERTPAWHAKLAAAAAAYGPKFAGRGGPPTAVVPTLLGLLESCAAAIADEYYLVTTPYVFFRRPLLESDFGAAPPRVGYAAPAALDPDPPPPPNTTAAPTPVLVSSSAMLLSTAKMRKFKPDLAGLAFTQGHLTNGIRFDGLPENLSPADGLFNAFFRKPRSPLDVAADASGRTRFAWRPWWPHSPDAAVVVFDHVAPDDLRALYSVGGDLMPRGKRADVLNRCKAEGAGCEAFMQVCCVCVCVVVVAAPCDSPAAFPLSLPGGVRGDGNDGSEKSRPVGQRVSGCPRRAAGAGSAAQARR